MNSTPEDNEEPARPDGKSFTVVYHPRSNVKGYRDFTDLNLANAFLKERIAAGDVKARLVSGEAKTTRPAPRLVEDNEKYYRLTTPAETARKQRFIDNFVSCFLAMEDNPTAELTTEAIRQAEKAWSFYDAYLR